MHGPPLAPTLPKVLAARWGGLSIEVIDVRVQASLRRAANHAIPVDYFNSQAEPPGTFLIRGGGGAAGFGGSFLPMPAAVCP